MRFTQFSIVFTTVLASQVFISGKPTGKPRENSNSQLLGCRGNEEAAEEASRKNQRIKVVAGDVELSVLMVETSIEQRSLPSLPSGKRLHSYGKCSFVDDIAIKHDDVQ